MSNDEGGPVQDGPASPSPASSSGADPAGDPLPPPGGRRRFRLRLGRPRLPRSRRGMAGLLLILGALGAAGMGGTIQVIHWTETADFCGRCHTMGPELQAHAAGPHARVTCGECHVEPGVEGWIKSKINGSRQLAEIVLGTYPQPIPPPEHGALPSVEDTCLHCHNVNRLSTARLITRTQYTEDEQNTRQFVGLLIRPGGGDVFDVNRSVHWHILQDVDYRLSDDGKKRITWVSVTRENGEVREFIAQDEVRLAQDVGPDLARLKAAGEPSRMDCLDCHNRVGHPISNPRKGLDASLASGRIDPRLPYIKREGMRILWADYPAIAAADREAERLRDFYQLRYPEIAQTQSRAINRAIDEIKLLYRLTATPEIRVTASTYPDNLGHTDFVGCFRCHDGGHFLVRDGAVTADVIPSRCDACHTFPQIGEVASMPLGIPPDSHDDSLFIFNHRDLATSVDPGGTSCGDCHARDYCINCHVTGAVNVEHDAMLIDHARVIRASGAESCAYCHQPVYCARCHAEPVMPGSAPWVGADAGPLTPTNATRWPLVARPAAAPNQEP
jgi:hypothetical protein